MVTLILRWGVSPSRRNPSYPSVESQLQPNVLLRSTGIAVELRMFGKANMDHETERR